MTHSVSCKVLSIAGFLSIAMDALLRRSYLDNHIRGLEWFAAVSDCGGYPWAIMFEGRSRYAHEGFIPS